MMESISQNSISTEDSLKKKESFNANHNDKFEYVINSLRKYKKNPYIYVTSKYNKNTQSLYIQVVYKKNTEQNIMSYDLTFSILIDKDYPNTIPIVKTCTAFSFPTIFDNRNLLFSIINHNWVNKNQLNLISDIVEPIEEIINLIPKFLVRLVENTNNKILVYYGDYKIDTIYDMNEFLCNTDLDFYKVIQQMMKKKEKIKKERYVILTDIYFLLFDSVQSSKNLAKLLFWGDIRQIVTCKGNSFGSDSANETLYLEWKSGGSKKIIFELSFLSGSTKEFIEKSNRKILRLKENYKIFQDDINKPIENEIVSKFNDFNILNTNLEKLIALVKYKEEILEKSYSINIVRELMSLYQQIIEIMSAKGDLEFKVYLDKLHTMLEKLGDDK